MEQRYYRALSRKENEAGSIKGGSPMFDRIAMCLLRSHHRFDRTLLRLLLLGLVLFFGFSLDSCFFSFSQFLLESAEAALVRLLQRSVSRLTCFPSTASRFDSSAASSRCTPRLPPQAPVALLPSLAFSACSPPASPSRQKCVRVWTRHFSCGRSGRGRR